MTEPKTTERELWERIEAINEKWQAGRIEELRPYFDPDSTIVSADLRQRGEGRDAVLGSYSEFVRMAKIEELRTEEPVVQVFGDTAVAAYRFTLRYEMGGEARDDAGTDLMVFVRRPEGWQVVWRTIYDLPKDGGE